MMSDELLKDLEWLKTNSIQAVNGSDIFHRCETRIRKLEALLDECERVIDNALFLKGKHMEDANALLAKLRGEQ